MSISADIARIAYGKKTVLKDVKFELPRGSLTAVIGRNGSGKSCMFRAIMGELRTQELFVRYDDKVVTGSDEMGKYVKYLAQKPFLPPKLTLKKVFEYFGADYEAFTDDFPKFAQYPDTPVRELSGGEVRIAEIWLCLCSDAPFCILDEPFSYLSPVAIEVIQKLIGRQKEKMGIVVSDHNYEALLEIADEVLLLSDGYVHLIKDRSDLVRYGYCRA